MRTLVRALFVSLALTSSFAVACPIDLAPCEVAMLSDAAVSSLKPTENIRPTNGLTDDIPLQTALFDEQRNTAVAGGEAAAAILGDSECWDITDALSMFSGDAEEADASVDVDITGSGVPRAVSSLGNPELALDGYEDR